MILCAHNTSRLTSLILDWNYVSTYLTARFSKQRNIFKGTVAVISIKKYKKRNAGFTLVLFKPLSDQLCGKILVLYNEIYSILKIAFLVSDAKMHLSHFFRETTIENCQLFKKMLINILCMLVHCTKLLRVLLWIGHGNILMKNNWEDGTKSVHQNLLVKTLPVTLKHILFNLKYFHFSLIMLAVYWLYGD